MKKTFHIAILVLALSLFGCGGSGGGGETPAPVDPGSSADTTAPSVSAQSPAGRLITTGNSISLTFDESIDTGSFSLGGNLAAESDGGVWSQTNVINDTLTITPTGSWSVDTERTLIINAKDLAGNAMAELTISHDVYRGTPYYVSSTAANDEGDGLSVATAKLTILAAINAATVPATVVVNAGTYAVSAAPESRVELVEGVSLYGGYSADFTARTPRSSVVTSATTYAVHGSGYSLTRATRIDGFTLQGPGNSLVGTILLESGASPTIQNNTLQGMVGIKNNYSAPDITGNTFEIYATQAGGNCYGIWNEYASPAIKNNTVEIDKTTINCNSNYGIYNKVSHPLIQDNVIDAGNTSGSGYGIINWYSSPSISGNTINAGKGEYVGLYGIYNYYSSPIISGNTINGGSSDILMVGIFDDGSSNSTIHNNVISGGSDGLVGFGDQAAILMQNNAAPTIIGNTLVSPGHCISETTYSSDPAALQFNNFQSCGVLYRDEAATDINDITAVNALGDIVDGVFGNFISP